MFLIGILAMYWMQVSGYAHGVVNAFDAFCLNIATADRLMHLFLCHENGKLIKVIDYTVRFCFFSCVVQQ